MAKKKRTRKRARKSTTKTTHHKRKRARRSNPSKRTHRRTHARRAHSSPKHTHRRKRRRNPSDPMVQAALAAAAGVAGFVGVWVANQVVNKKLDPNIRRGIGAAVAGGGLLLAKKKPLMGAALAAGGAAAAVGNDAAIAVIKLLPAPKPAGTSGIGAVVSGGRALGMGAVVSDHSPTMGAVVPPAPWTISSPL